MVVDRDYRMHAEACSYLAGQRARWAYNTEKTYAPRVALYLSYCPGHGVDWAHPSLPQLAGFLGWLVDEPLPPRGNRPRAKVRHRSENSASAIMGTVGDFLSWCSKFGWVPLEVVNLLSRPKYLRFLPDGFDPGEDGHNRIVQARTLRFPHVEPGLEWFTEGQPAAMLEAATHARDRFLVGLMLATAIRIGEALGLRREDMHLLPDSTPFGCNEPGPHIHVVRRANGNGVYAKSPHPRSIPVESEVVWLYTEYQYERDAVPEARDCDMVFVNLFRAPLGGPMKYPNAYELFKRLGSRAGISAHPHMTRHTTITQMRRAGRAREEVQAIAGHQSESSQDRYSHVTSTDLREAVRSVPLPVKREAEQW